MNNDGVKKLSIVEGNLMFTKRRGAARRQRMSLAFGRKDIVFHILFVADYDISTNFWPLPKLEKRRVQSPRIFISEKGRLGPEK